MLVHIVSMRFYEVLDFDVEGAALLLSLLVRPHWLSLFHP